MFQQNLEAYVIICSTSCWKMCGLWCNESPLNLIFLRILKQYQQYRLKSGFWNKKSTLLSNNVSKVLEPASTTVFFTTFESKNGFWNNENPLYYSLKNTEAASTR